MKKIRVLQFPMANAYGGITQYTLQNWRYIDKTRFQFDFATLCKDKLYFEDEVAAQGCKVYHISCYAEENEEQFTKEVKDILSSGYDAVHLHTSYWKSFMVEELAKEAEIPKIIIHAHSTSVLEEDNREERITHHNRCVSQLKQSTATDFWACSWEAARWLYGDSIPTEKIVIQKNAIDIDRFMYKPETAQKIRRELGWEDKYIIGHVGRFTYSKNHEFLLHIFREISKKNKDVRLLLVGIGPGKTRIEELVKDWGLQEKVQFLGKRNDVHDIMQGMDCFVLPSLFEGLPIVLIEAQASGCECMAADTISEESFLTENIHRLPLKEDIWISRLLQFSKETKSRHNQNADMLRRCGFDIKDQIRKIEEGYIRWSEKNR